ncbi:glycoside hydrolase family 2 protein [Ferrimonas senticii]|uniref:glycoside hydrolase family 2 protein n=1 Tax=Ferrimonas senticii TaxID=394566 RepID=UPI0004167F6A|nr:glycoside hydrolase family 2 [Ferrimonas senticii]
MKPLLWAAALMLLLSGCQNTPATSLLSTLPSLNGQWRFDAAVSDGEDLSPLTAEFDDSHWPLITVPGNWYRDGFDTHGKHWFRKQFQLAEQPQQALQLAFEGIDYQAKVWLNGQYLGAHQGYFAAFSFEVTDHLIVGTNTLAVLVDSPLEAQTDASWSLHKRLIKGVLSHHDTRPGGAWSVRGQERNSGGIWGKVALIAKPVVPLTELRWRTEVEDKQAQGQLQFRIDNNRSVEGWRLTFNGVGFEQQRQFEFAANAGATQSLLLPWQSWRLWWPREYGQPNQYRLRIEAKIDGDYHLSKALTVGFRQMDYDGQLGQWYLNQQRLFLRGTNYIPSLYMSEVDETLIRRDLALMAAANINIVRVHAMLLPQRFYQIANELGMMVWQDFPLQWGYIDSAEFHAEAQRQLKQMLYQFGHHPAIVAWAAHNEPPWDADWMRWKYPDYHPEQNRQLDLGLYATLTSVDRSRPAFVASLTKEHPWLGWYSGSWQDYGKPSEQALITEFGAQALPDLPVWAAVVDIADDLALPEDFSQWQFHNFQPQETFDIAGVERAATVPELIENTQRYQAKLIRYAAESYRRQKYQPVGAIFQFMLVEHWPSANWGVLDFNRNPKRGYHALQTAYQPLLPSIYHHQQRFSRHQPIRLPVYLINDYPRGFAKAQLQLQLRFDGELLDSRSEAVAIEPDSVLQLADYVPSALAIGRYQLQAKVFDGARKLLGQAQFEFEVSDD